MIPLIGMLLSKWYLRTFFLSGREIMLTFTVVDDLEQIPDDTPTEADTDNTILVTQATI